MVVSSVYKHTNNQCKGLISLQQTDTTDTASIHLSCPETVCSSAVTVLFCKESGQKCVFGCLLNVRDFMFSCKVQKHDPTVLILC